MGSLINIILVWLFFGVPLSTSTTEDADPLETEMLAADRWVYRKPHQSADMNFDEHQPCLSVHPLTRDIVKRFYALLPYFRKENSETVFLHKLRGTIYSMSESDDILDRETAFYATMLTPLLFLQNYRDTWCLLERFHRSLRLFQMSHPTEKRSALKLLQNLRPVNQKIREMILEWPGVKSQKTLITRTPVEEESQRDQKEIRFVKELIKNLG